MRESRGDLRVKRLLSDTKKRAHNPLCALREIILTPCSLIRFLRDPDCRVISRSLSIPDSYDSFVSNPWSHNN